jgi:hypothetical protein
MTKTDFVQCGRKQAQKQARQQVQKQARQQVQKQIYAA